MLTFCTILEQFGLAFQIAKKMLEKGMTDEEIIELTGITSEELAELRGELVGKGEPKIGVQNCV